MDHKIVEAENLESAARIWIDLPENRSPEKIHDMYRDVLMEDGLLSRLTEKEFFAICEKVLREVA